MKKISLIITCIFTTSISLYGQNWLTSGNNFATTPPTLKLGTISNHKFGIFVNNIERLSFDNVLPEIKLNGTLNIFPPSADYKYGINVITNNALTKGFAVTGNSGDLFAIWGNGVVNAKKIYAEEISVRADAIGISWPDYVFKDNYKLMPLDSVKFFIKNNSHLPDIPNEKEIKSNGINVAEFNALLLKKIEELTLYILEQEKRIKALETSIK